MKRLEEFILEKLKISKIETNYKPKNKEELVKLIIEEIETNGPECSLNNIDVSNITDMSYLFMGGDPLKYLHGHPVLSGFDGDISEWNVSNVRAMSYMFEKSKFNGDLSKWDVSNVKRFTHIFMRSSFSGDISNWKINPDAKDHMQRMFSKSPLENNPPAWYNN